VSIKEGVRMKRRVLWLVLVLVCAVSGCASLAPSTGTELDRAGEAAYSQVQLMSLVSEAAMRDLPPTVSLQVMLDGAETQLSEKENAVVKLSPEQRHRDQVLALIRQSRHLLQRLRVAVDSGDDAALRQLETTASQIGSRLEALGMA
jgi:tRNA A37 methylthiotransferase MiaB